MNLSETSARYFTRKAWLALGKAREARSSMTFLANDELYRNIQHDYTRDMVRIARQFMRLAIMYRTEIL